MKELRKDHRRRKVSVEKKVGECHLWKATGQCSRGDSCCFSHGTDRGQKAQSSSPTPKAQTQTDGSKPSKGFSRPSGRKGWKACKKFLKGKCADLSCTLWHLPVCHNDKSESGCKFGDKCQFRHVETDGQLSKKVEEKWCERICCIIEGVKPIRLCVSRFSSDGKKEILEQIAPSNSPR